MFPAGFVRFIFVHPAYSYICVSSWSFICEDMKVFLKPATLFFCWGCPLLRLTTVMCSCLPSIVYCNTHMSFHHPQVHYLCVLYKASLCDSRRWWLFSEGISLWTQIMCFACTFVWGSKLCFYLLLDWNTYVYEYLNFNVIPLENLIASSPEEKMMKN